MADLDALSLAFAQAVVRPDGNALMIDADNKKRLGAGGQAMWVPVSEAVTLGGAFAVEPREGVVALDLDSPAEHTWAARVREELSQLGCRFVLTNSGRPGHGHLWIIAPPGWSSEALKKRAYAVAGADVDKHQIRAGNAVRPPFSPHRHLQVRSEVVEPGWATALAWFRSAHGRDLGEVARKRLQRFPQGAVLDRRGEPSRGLTLKAVALAAVNARWTFDQFRAELRDPANLTAFKYREMPPATRDDWAEGVWEEAVERVRRSPALPSSQLARAEVERLLTCMNEHPWTSRTGATDRAVYRALLDIGMAAARTEVSASVRQLSSRLSVGKNGVQRALVRLHEGGLIERCAESAPAQAATYRLVSVYPERILQGVPQGVPGGGSAPAGALPEKVESRADGDTISPLRGARGSLVSPLAALLDDVFTNGVGLGLSAKETWEALPAKPTKTSQVASLRPPGLTVATVRNHLRRLHQYGLAGRRGQRWWRLIPSEQSLRLTAEALGVRGKTAGRKARHDAESASWRRRNFIAEQQESA